MPAATAQTLFTQAWVDLGVGFPGETPPASESANGLAKLNQMLDSWSGARDLVYEIASATYLLTAIQSNAIGPTGTAPFNVARPIKVENAQIVITVGAKLLSFDLEIVPQTKWQGLSDKAATATVPLMLYVDPSVPNAVLNLWPIPLCTAVTYIELGTWNPVGQFATLATSINLPPTYQRAIVLGLQLELIPTYGNLVSPNIIQTRGQQFQEAIGLVRQLNSTVQMADFGPVTPQGASEKADKTLAQLAAALGKK